MTATPFTIKNGATITGTVTATAFSGDGSALTGITSTTINNNADNRVITGSATANTLEGEANLIFDGTNLGIGTTSPSYKLHVVGDAYVSTDLTVAGDLTVNGTTTTINTTNTQVSDNLLELNSGATANTNDAGIIIERGSTGNNAIMAWDESADQFIFGTTTATASDTGNLTITASPISVGNITSSGQLYLNDSNSGYLIAYPSGQIYHDVRGTTSIDNSTYVYHQLSHPGGSNFTGESLQYSNNGFYTLNGNNATRAFNLGSFGVHHNNRQIYGSGSETVTLSVGTLDSLDFGYGTLTTAVHYDAAATYGGGTSNITNYIGYRTKPLQTNASFNVTNAYGFYSDIADDSGAHYNFYAAGTGPNYFNGRVGIGITNPGVALDVSGAIRATGDITAFYTSDETLKTNIANIENPMQKVSQLNGVSYNWTQEAQAKYDHLGDQKEVGVIAQQVEKVLPEMVAQRDDGTKAVRYERMCALLIECVKDLQKQIDDLKKGN